MVFALFGINNGALNLIVNLLVLFLVVVYFALIAWTYFDAKRRMEDQVLVMCAVGASLFPFIGTVVYTILRPPEFLEDAREREVETRAAELRLRQLSEQSCPNCDYPLEKSFLRCPNCQARVKDPCPSCKKPLDPRWVMCPYCETPVQRRSSTRRRAPGQPKAKQKQRRQAPGPVGRRTGSGKGDEGAKDGAEQTSRPATAS
jgi:Double zinc ribbon